MFFWGNILGAKRLSSFYVETYFPSADLGVRCIGIPSTIFKRNCTLVQCTAILSFYTLAVFTLETRGKKSVNFAELIFISTKSQVNSRGRAGNRGFIYPSFAEVSKMIYREAMIRAPQGACGYSTIKTVAGVHNADIVRVTHRKRRLQYRLRAGAVTAR